MRLKDLCLPCSAHCSGDATQGGWCLEEEAGSKSGTARVSKWGRPGAHVVTVWWKAQSDGRRYGGAAHRTLR